jgi:L-aminopeptidase/D-esterase-like protein
MRHVLRASLLAVAVLGLGGCGDSKPGQEQRTKADSGPAAIASQDAAPATGTPIAGTGYVVRAAKGWYDIKKGLGSTTEDSDIKLGTTHGSVMNVQASPNPAALKRSGIADFLTTVVITSSNMKKLGRSTPIVVAGARGLSTKVRFKTDQGVARGRVVAFVHGDENYVIVASSSPKEPKPTTGDFAAMLSSWHWSG